MTSAQIIVASVVALGCLSTVGGLAFRPSPLMTTGRASPTSGASPHTIQHRDAQYRQGRSRRRIRSPAFSMTNGDDNNYFDNLRERSMRSSWTNNDDVADGNNYFDRFDMARGRPFRATTDAASSKNGRATNSNGDRHTDYFDMVRLEREVNESTRTKLDWKRVTEAVVGGDDEHDPYRTERKAPPLAAPKESRDPLNVSLAAGFAVGSLAFLSLHNWFLSLVAFGAVAVLALGDPLDENNAAGAASRILGRVTLNSVQEYQPKLEALTKAALTDKAEIDELKTEVARLKKENDELSSWVKRRMHVDAHGDAYSWDQLIRMARFRGVDYAGGSKVELLMRLMEEGVLVFDEESSSSSSSSIGRM